MIRNKKTNKLVRWLTLSSMMILLMILLLNVSCSWGKIPTKNYYTISYTPTSSPSATSGRPYQYSIQVGRFEVQQIYNRLNIIYRYSPHEIQFYELERWAVRPDYMLKDMVFKHLEASKLTNRVGIDYFDVKPDYRIEGVVEALEKFDAGDLFFAHLAMTFKMLKVSDGSQIWEYSFDQRRQVYSAEMIQTVRALSSILQAEMDLVITQLDDLFLATETGLPARNSQEPVYDMPALPDSTKIDLEDPGFEIIPDKQR